MDFEIARFALQMTAKTITATALTQEVTSEPGEEMWG